MSTTECDAIETLKQMHTRETLALIQKQEYELADLKARIAASQKDHDDRGPILWPVSSPLKTEATRLPSLSPITRVCKKRKRNDHAPGAEILELPKLAPRQAPVVRSKPSKFFPVPRVPKEAQHAQANNQAYGQMRQLASLQQRSLLKPGNKRPCQQIQLPRSVTKGSQADKENELPR